MTSKMKIAGQLHKKDTAMMKRCFRLALGGRGKVSPNPLVGALVVKGKRIIGEGFHTHFGGNHAEVNAIRDAEKKGFDVSGSTMYVNLEPCSHFGKTPPCVSLIIRKGIHKIFIGIIDPNPLVAGTGIALLRDAGIQCVVDVERKDSEHLNRFFLQHVRTGLPFITMKLAQTKDAFIAREDGIREWITSPQSAVFVHSLRSEHDAVLVGAGTIIEDDPELTVRIVKGRNPLRIIIDGSLSIPLTAKVLNDENVRQTIIYTSASKDRMHEKQIKKIKQKGATVVGIRGKQKVIPLYAVLHDLGKREIGSVLVEGGFGIFTQFLDQQLIQHLVIINAAKKFGRGIPGISSRSIQSLLAGEKFRRVGSDRIIEGAPNYG